jgi:hypothetical protein
MARTFRKPFPRSIYGVLGAGSFIATGIYIEKGVLQGFTAWTVVRIAVFFILGCLWTWGVVRTGAHSAKSE